MRTNPLFREGVRVYFMEGQAFPACFYVLILLSIVELLTLFLPSLDSQMWKGPANLFKISSITALVLVIYFALRAANQEFVPWRFLPLRRWLRQEGLAVRDVVLGHLGILCVHVSVFALLCLPLLIWAGAISRAAPLSILSAFSLLLFYSLSYGLWGLVALALWEHRIENRQVFIRALFISLIFLSALVYLPLNPIAFLLHYLENREMAPLVLWGWPWRATAIHFVFHIFISGAALLLFRWAVKREAQF